VEKERVPARRKKVAEEWSFQEGKKGRIFLLPLRGEGKKRKVHKEKGPRSFLFLGEIGPSPLCPVRRERGKGVWGKGEKNKKKGANLGLLPFASEGIAGEEKRKAPPLDHFAEGERGEKQKR